MANYLYNNCSAPDIAFAKANLGKQPVAPFARPVQATDAVYGVIPKYNIICAEARNGNMSKMTTNVALQKTVTIKTNHSPFFSQPESLMELLVSF